ncbi:MAG TPA: AAA family ATPase [Candidatus Eisenbacteria bacterium]
MSAGLERFAELLIRARKRVVWNPGHTAFKFCCCLHDDLKPSADARAGDQVLVIAACQVCGPAAALPLMLEELGATDADRDLILGGAPSHNGDGASPSTEVVHHDYRDAAGTPVLRVVRHLRHGKTVKLQRQYWNAGEWCWPRDLPRGFAKPDTRALLYNAAAVIEAARSGGTVYIGEGERVVDALIALGLPGTCNVGGASEDGRAPKWTPGHAEQLRGAAAAVVFEDHDSAGRAHGRAEAASLAAVGTYDIRTVRFSDLGEHSDLVDWLGPVPTGERRARLDALVAAAPRWAAEKKPDAPQVEYLDLATIRDAGIPAVPWIVPGWLAEGDIALAPGDGGIGKSTTIAALAMAVATGGAWCGIQVARAGPVLVFDEEQSVREVSRLYLRLGAPHHQLRVASQQGVNLTTAEGLQRIEYELGAHRPLLVVFDSVQQVFAGIDGNDAGAVAAVYATLFRLRRDYDTTFALIGHLRKPASDGHLAKLHLVHGSVAFSTQASTVWVASQPARGLMDLVQVKRRDGERASLRIRYTTAGPDAPIVLTGEGSVDEGETTTERAEDFVLKYLVEKGASPAKWIIAAAAAEAPPLPARSIERALKRMTDVLRVIDRPRRGYYAPTNRPAGDPEPEE